MNELSNINVQTMSSLEIAKLTEKRHDNVMADITRILNEVEIGLLEFQGTYLTSQNKEYPCFNLPRRECDLVIAGYSAKYRLAIIDRWHELEKNSKTQSQLQIMAAQCLALHETNVRVEALEKEAKIQAQKQLEQNAELKSLSLDVFRANDANKSARLIIEKDDEKNERTNIYTPWKKK